MRGTIVAVGTVQGSYPDLAKFSRTKGGRMMKVLINRWKNLTLVIAGVIFVVFMIASVTARTATNDDTAALYKAKCFACHGATAEKKFDSAKPDDELIQIVLKGKKMEKPPSMPGYEEKGVTAEQAKAVVAFMKSLKQ